MRHRKAGVKLNRTSSHRKAMFRNMVTSLFKHDRIRTTDAKAKELRRWADNLITLAKRGDLHARRQALSIVREKEVVHKLFNEVEDRFNSKAGGYTRIVRLGRRPGDAAPICLVELVSGEASGKKKKARKKKAEPAQKAPAVEKVKEAAPKEDTVETKPKKEKKTEPVEEVKETKAKAKKEKKAEAAEEVKETKTKAKAPKKSEKKTDTPEKDASKAEPESK